MPRTVKKIQRGADVGVTHRLGITTCPHCDAELPDWHEWRKYATHLVLEPLVFKVGCVAVVSECPNCFEPSWVHEHFSTFSGYREKVWPRSWRTAVARRELAVSIQVIEDWSKSLCLGCRYLKEIAPREHAWKSCEPPGRHMTGHPVTECEYYKKRGRTRK